MDRHEHEEIRESGRESPVILQKDLFFSSLNNRKNIPDIIKTALGAENGVIILSQTLDPNLSLTIEDRIIVALNIVKNLGNIDRDDRDLEKLRTAALTFLKDLFLLDSTRDMLLLLLGELDLRTIKAVKSFISKHIPGDLAGQKLLLALLNLTGSYWTEHHSVEAAYFYAETVLQAICFEGVDLRAVPLPGDSTEDAVPREILRRKLFAFVNNQDPKWNVVRPQRALAMLGAGELSPGESAFGAFDWRIYDLSYQYSLGLENRVDLRKIAQDLLEIEERSEYEAFAKLFSDESLALRIDGAYALIQATQFRTRKPKGPAEEYRLRAISLLETIFNDTAAPPGIWARILDIYRGMGNLPPIFKFFREKLKAKDIENAEAALIAAISCFSGFLSKDEQKIHQNQMIETFVDTVKEGGEDIYLTLLESLPSRDGDLIKGFRRELKILLADVDVGPAVRRRALEALGRLGEEKQGGKRPSPIFTEILEEPEEDEAPQETVRIIKEKMEEVESEKVEAPQVERKGEVLQTLPARLKEFLRKRVKLDELKAMCAGFLAENDPQIMAYYSHLFSARDPESCDILYEHQLACSRVLVEHLRKKEGGGVSLKPEEKTLDRKAKEALFFTLFDRNCPDLVKMEAFEILKNLHYFDMNKADTLKKFSLAFAKEALSKRSGSTACKSLSDLISLRTPPPSIGSLEGKSFQELVEDFTARLIREKEFEKMEGWISLLHYVSFQESQALKPLSNRLHPLNYREVLKVIEELVRLYNKPAGNLLVEAIEKDYRDIRNLAVTIIGKVGSFLYKDQKIKAIASILAKIDDCYDDEKRKEFREALVKIDAELAAEKLLIRCLGLRYHERKEFGDILFKSLERMSATSFISFCDSDSHLEELKTFILKGPGDSLMQQYAKRFLGLYRENFIHEMGKDRWNELQSAISDPRRSIIREISKAM